MSEKSLTFEELFDPDFLASLEPFKVLARKVARGGRQADQVSIQHGSGMEFADYKPYVAGDDPRAIDWNIYRRLGRIFIKKFEERRDLPVYIFVDVSKSMFFGDVPRIGAGLRTALALASISMQQHDSVSLYSFSGDLSHKVNSRSGKSGLLRFANHLIGLSEDGQSHLALALRQFASHNRRRGLMIIVSDFFDPSGLEHVFSVLNISRQRLVLVQLVREQDANPTQLSDMQGDIRLSDCETQDTVDVSVTPAVLARYKEVYSKFNKKLIDFARAQGAGLVRVDTDKDVLEQLSQLFETGNLVV